LIEPIKPLAGWVVNYAVALRLSRKLTFHWEGALHAPDLNNGLMQSAPTFEHLED